MRTLVEREERRRRKRRQDHDEGDDDKDTENGQHNDNDVKSQMTTATMTAKTERLAALTLNNVESKLSPINVDSTCSIASNWVNVPS